MNKTMIYGMLTALFALASCMGNGNPVSLSDLEGEWNVVELAGQSVNTKQQPFIGFDTREMRVYGYGGCNRLMGSFEWSDESARMVMDRQALEPIHSRNIIKLQITDNHTQFGIHSKSKSF